MQPAIPQPVAAGSPRRDRAFWRGVWVGLAPLALTVGSIAVAVALAILARLLAAPVGFLFWRWIVAGVWISGLVITAAVFAYAAFRVLRRVTAWQREGQIPQASGACWALGVTALVVLLPLLVALVFS